MGKDSSQINRRLCEKKVCTQYCNQRALVLILFAVACDRHRTVGLLTSPVTNYSISGLKVKDKNNVDLFWQLL